LAAMATARVTIRHGVGLLHCAAGVVGRG
jgi:hypothetical protein